MNERHFQSLIFVIESLLASHARPAWTSGEIERQIAIASVLYPSVDEALLRRDIELVLETSGAVLLGPRNRGRRIEIIRGVLR